jgi:hypothetical protein
MSPSTVMAANMALLDAIPSWLFSVLPPMGVSHRASQSTASTFLETYLGSVSLRTLLRVARC